MYNNGCALNAIAKVDGMCYSVDVTCSDQLKFYDRKTLSVNFVSYA